MQAHNDNEKTSRHHLALWAAMAVTLLSLPWFFVAINFGSNAVAWGKTMDAFHFVFFALFAWWLLRYFRYLRTKKPALTAGLTVFVVISLVEIIQPLFGRSGSITDLASGAVGGLSMLLVCSLWQKKTSGLRNISLLALVLISFSVTAYGAVEEWYAVYWRDQNMPLLGSFETSTEMRLWHAAGYADGGASKILPVTKHATDQKHSLRVITQPGSWSGAWYQAGGLDWSDYQYLTMTVYNPGHEFQLKVRIDDARPSPQYSSRINTSVTVKHGKNNIEVNLRDAATKVRQGDFDMTSIEKIVLFTSKKAPSLTFYLDDVRLK